MLTLRGECVFAFLTIAGCRLLILIPGTWYLPITTDRPFNLQGGNGGESRNA